jgi:hypothetical protein
VAWDANGSPIEGVQHHPLPSPLKGVLSDLFVAYREALSQALSDGDLSKLDEAHGRIRECINQGCRA